MVEGLPCREPLVAIELQAALQKVDEGRQLVWRRVVLCTADQRRERALAIFTALERTPGRVRRKRRGVGEQIELSLRLGGAPAMQQGGRARMSDRVDTRGPTLGTRQSAHAIPPPRLT